MFYCFSAQWREFDEAAIQLNAIVRNTEAFPRANLSMLSLIGQLLLCACRLKAFAYITFRNATRSKYRTNTLVNVC